MDKNNPLFVKNYEEWKKNLWGAFRAFMGGFLASLATHFVGINGDKIVDTEWWVHVVLISSLVGGFVFLGKWLRDTFPESVLMQRLPI